MFTKLKKLFYFAKTVTNTTGEVLIIITLKILFKK